VLGGVKLINRTHSRSPQRDLAGHRQRQAVVRTLTDAQPILVSLRFCHTAFLVVICAAIKHLNILEPKAADHLNFVPTATYRQDT